jgi:serine/threonine-protein kinase
VFSWEGSEDDNGVVTLDRVEVPGKTISGTTAIVDREAALLETGERYVRLRTLGEGGMGEVHLCQDRQIGRTVAMKVVRPEHDAEPDRRGRFLREARIQGQLEHPAIVPVYDLARGQDGHQFFTMKRVRGQTLEDVLGLLRKGDAKAEREFTRHMVLSAFTRVCLAVDFAHDRGIIHRDLKPANLMFGRFGEVYVLDWGLAKRVEKDELSADEWPGGKISIASGTFTAAGQVVGTPAYMAPEQIQGQGENVGPPADVYALGAILFEILTFETLHGTDSPIRMFQRALAGVEARPSLRAPDRTVPPELEAICVRATARKPENRFGSARELAEAIEAHLAGDRDVVLRQELAQRHLSSARDAAARALVETASTAERTEALHEAGRAIALSPDNDDALRLLVDLLTAPPKSPPPEVLAEVERTRVESLATLRRIGAICYTIFGVLLASLSLALGNIDVRRIAIASVAWFVAAGTAYYGSTWATDRNQGNAYRIFTVAGAVAVALSSLVGAVFIIPAMAAVITMGQMFTTVPSNRVFVVSANVLAVLAPTVLVAVGLVPNPWEASTPIATLVFVGVIGNAIIVMAARFAARCRDELTAAQTRNALQTWQLRRLVPERAKLPEEDGS